MKHYLKTIVTAMILLSMMAAGCGKITTQTTATTTTLTPTSTISAVTTLSTAATPATTSATPISIPDTDYTEIVTFPDAALEQAIRNAIDKPTGDIYQSDLDKLTDFSAMN